MQLAREYGFGKVQRKTAAAVNAAGYHYTLLLNDDLKIPDAGVRIRSSVHAGPRVQKLRNHWKALFDLKDISAPLTVRNFRTGDRFRPFGMKGRKKLKNLFIDLKVPSEVRRTWPFLLSGEEILWIPGYARSDLATVRTDTRRVLRVEARSLLS
jgi:tRNA(Ile)-lysidine synthase